MGFRRAREEAISPPFQTQKTRPTTISHSVMYMTMYLAKRERRARHRFGRDGRTGGVRLVLRARRFRGKTQVLVDECSRGFPDVFRARNTQRTPPDPPLRDRNGRPRPPTARRTVLD